MDRALSVYNSLKEKKTLFIFKSLFWSRMYSCKYCVSHVLSYSFVDTVKLLVAVCILHLFMSQTRAGLLYRNSKSLNICASCEISSLLDLKINSCFEMQIQMCTKDLQNREYPFFCSFHWGAVFIQQINMILWWKCFFLQCQVVTFEIV